MKNNETELTSADYQELANQMKEKAAELRRKAAAAKKAEEAKAKEEARQARVNEAINLYDLASEVTISERDANGNPKQVTVLEFLRKEYRKQHPEKNPSNNAAQQRTH